MHAKLEGGFGEMNEKSNIVPIRTPKREILSFLYMRKRKTNCLRWDSNRRAPGSQAPLTRPGNMS